MQMIEFHSSIWKQRFVYLRANVVNIEKNQLESGVTVGKCLKKI